jgi:MinD-like ATPase involved in chromosome partitioning or flagellar assembly
LNRADGGGGISRRDAETILGRTPDAFIPEDKDIVRGVTEGLPIVLANERSVAARAFTDLAKEYVKEFDASEQSAPGAIEATAALNGKPKAKRSLTATLLGRGAN